MSNTASSAHLRRLVHAICWGGVSTLTLSGLSATAGAADTTSTGSAESSDLNEIVVTGIRASLQQSLDIKRDSFGIVDAISAEDIGKFPDANLATAMERIPGVTVSRATMLVAGTSGTNGEASQITVRGFGPTFNETLFDGRQVPTAVGSRAFDFGSVGSDFVGQVDVMKTPDSTLSSGAIGATVNIKYPKPFDHPGFHVAGSLSGTDATPEDKIKPGGGILVSDTFADDRFGVLADFSYKETRSRVNHINIQGWEGAPAGLKPCQLKGAPACVPNATDPNDTASIKDWFIQDYGIYQEHDSDKRFGGRIALQARPMDGLEITLDNNFAEEQYYQTQYGFSAWFNNSTLSNVVQAPDGTVLSFTQPGSDTDFQAQVNKAETHVDTTGLNIKWDATEHTSYVADLFTSIARLSPGGPAGLDADVGYGNGNGVNETNIGIVVPGGKSIPYPINYGPAGNAASFTNPAILGSHVLVTTYNENKDSINQFKLEGRWADDSFKFKYGLQFTHDHFQLNGFTNLPYTWQMYAGYGPAPTVGSGGVAPLPANLVSQTFSTGSNFISGWGGGGNLPAAILAANGYAIKGYLEGLNGAGMNVGACSNLTGAVPCTGKYLSYPKLGATQDIVENTLAPYLSLSESTKVGSLPLNISAGVRLEDTHTISGGVSSLPEGQLYILSTDKTAYGFNPTAPEQISTKNSYRYILPNLDLTLGLTDTIRARFDVSRTLTRPPLNLLTPDLNIPAGQRIGALNGTGGNPNLLPFLSDNVDLGVEWYYAQNSYVSADAFVKEVTNFVVGGTVNETVNNVTLPNGNPAYFAVTSQVNGPSAEVRGIELAWQYTIGDTGFGFLSNATFVGTNKPYDPNSLVSGFAVTGLANSWNFIPFYDKYGVNLRLAINHRAEYLDVFGQTQNNSLLGTEPTFVNAATYLDLSASYAFNKHFDVFFTAQNLTDQIYSTHGRFKEQLLDVEDTGRVFTIGVHAKL